MANELNIYVVKFYTKVKERSEGDVVLGEDGNPVLEDWCSYAPRGQDRSVVNESIARLSKVNHNVQKDHPAYVSANGKWEFIRPLYEAWKKGEELPTEGTPLGVANFIRTEDADVIKRSGVRTLEELIALPEHLRDQLRLPRVREMVAQAKKFLEMHDRNLAISEVKKRDDEIDLLKQQVEMLVAQAGVMAAENAEKKRGRPSNAEIAARQEALNDASDGNK